MLISDFEYDLPQDLIAQEPLEHREASRMLLVDRKKGTFDDKQFTDITQYLRDGDVLVLNNTKVFPARLLGTSETGARIEIFLVREIAPGVWETLARPARRLKPGKRINFGTRLTAEMLERSAEGHVIVRFGAVDNFDKVLDEIGKTPLPPYIRRDAGHSEIDRGRYQTVFAKDRGAIAAPTAGLHFTDDILDQVRHAGVTIAEITLHVGYGTFEPVRVSDLDDHKVSAESFKIDEITAETLNLAKLKKKRIIAVGTTTTRALETTMSRFGNFTHGSHIADLTITPGYNFRAIDGLLTNFHLPQSSLLVLTGAFGGYALIMEAYRHAVIDRYRFYSYGDCMLII